MGTPFQLNSPFLLELLSGQLGDLYPRYADLRRMGAMLRDASGIIVVTRHREVAQILADPAFAFVGPQTFPAAGAEQRARLDASGFFDLLMFRSGGEHRQTRRVLSELFSFNRIGRIRSAVEEMATGLARQLNGSLAFDFIPAVASTLPARMLVELIGLQAAEISTLVARSRAMTGLITAIPLAGNTLSDNIAAFETLCAWLDLRLIDPARGGDLHPFRDQLRALPAEARQSIVADLLVLLVTGYDTSRAMLGNAAAALIAHPEAAGQLAAEPALTPRAVEELIRYDTVGQIVFRHAIEDTSVGEHRIARGEMLALLIGSANRDEAAFDHPDRLDFARSKGRPLSLGIGPHACIGAAVAKIQLAAFLNAFAPCLSRAVADGPLPRARQHGLVRGHDSLVLRMSAHAA